MLEIIGLAVAVVALVGVLLALCACVSLFCASMLGSRGDTWFYLAVLALGIAAMWVAFHLSPLTIGYERAPQEAKQGGKENG